MKKEINRSHFVFIVILSNVLVLALLIGLSFIIIQVLFRGKIDKTFIPFLGAVFFLGSIFTTSLVYRLLMRRYFKTEHLDDVFKLIKKEKGKDKKS